MATQIARPAADFSPSLWGDIFIKHTSHAQASKECYDEIEALKNEVRNMLCNPESKMVDTIDLINTLERLGVSYHFENEIEDKLSQYFHLNTKYDEEDYDLYTVSLHFRLFRKHGHRISCDIFNKWIDGNGKFDEGVKRDAKGLLSLYEACYLRTHQDSILDQALDFATANLKSMLPNLGSALGKQVARALAQPMHLGTLRIDEIHFISIYEEFEHKNETLLRFSKLDFNLLQMLHRQELEEVSRWWKELDFYSRPPYARDRAVECFFWAMGVYHEPHFSRARVMLTKTIAL